MVVALKPIYDAAGIERVVVSTYQAVSGSGQGGIAALAAQARQWAAGEPVEQQFYPHQIAFNVLPHIDSFLPTGSTKEEQKMVDETVKIFADPDLKVTATCVRVPVFGAHSEAVNVQTKRKLSAAEARELLAAAPGIEVVDDPAELQYPMPLPAEGKDPVYVGRIREDVDHRQRPRPVGRLGQPAQGRGAQRGADRRGARGPGSALGRGRPSRAALGILTRSP